MLRKLALQYRAPQIAVAGAPLIAKHFSTTPFLWPPLGSIEFFSAYAATVLIALCSFVPEIMETKKQAKRLFLLSLLTATVTFGIYTALIGRYVITVDTPKDGMQARSVGSVVNPTIKAMFPDQNDEQLLMTGGLEEWQIQKVWTPMSVLAVRLSILFCFACTLASSNVALGAVARLRKPR